MNLQILGCAFFFSFWSMESQLSVSMQSFFFNALQIKKLSKCDQNHFIGDQNHGEVRVKGTSWTTSKKGPPLQKTSHPARK